MTINTNSIKPRTGFPWVKAVAALIAVLAVVVDQLSKLAALEKLRPVGSVPLIDGILNLTYTTNTGAAFGILSDSRWIFMSVSTLAILAMAAALFLWKKPHWMFAVSVALMLGGGIGNMIDRVFRGYVVDFFEFGFVEFAVFNVADACVCVGGALLCLYLFIFEMRNARQNPKNADAKPSQAGEGSTHE